MRFVDWVFLFGVVIVVFMTYNRQSARVPETIQVTVLIEPVEPRVLRIKSFTNQELEYMANHKHRTGLGISFYCDELRKHNDAKWAKEELDCRKTQNACGTDVSGIECQR